MDIETQPAPEGSPDPTPIVLDNDAKLLSVREAARQLSNWRKEKRESAPAPVEAPVQQDLAPEAETAAEEVPPSGETGAQPEARPAPIEPPVSWTAEEQERFASLPLETQEYLAHRERERDAEVNRRQREVAERLRALEPEQQALQQARAQYEQALPMLLQQMQANGEYADIRTMDDVQRLADDDPLRFSKYQAHVMKLQAYQADYQATQQRQQQEYMARWSQYATEQDRLFTEKVPDFADPDKAQSMRELTLDVMQKDYGFSLEEMQAAWNGPFRDARVQQILLDAAQWRNLKKNPPKPSGKPLPPVQKPGPSRGSVADTGAEAQIKALDTKFKQTGSLSLREAAAMQAAKRASQGR